MRLIDADALKEKKVYSVERHETVVPVAEIDWMPTVDAEPVRRGRWERQELAPTSYLFCSECGFPKKRGTWNFCPNCGADLREVENDG